MYSLHKDNLLNYEDMLDEDVIDIARLGHSSALDFLINKYKSLVKGKARTYFLIGGERDDIVQEGMIGLFKATRDYDRTKPASFRSFAELCVTRQIITAIKMATRQKHIPLNSYISLNRPIHEQESERTLLDMIEEAKGSDPLELFIGREEIDYIEVQILDILSELEWDVLSRYIEGKTYQEIADEINRDVKCVDNALQRVKKKLERNIKEESI